MEGTYTARFRDFEDNHTASIHSLHLYVKFLVTNDKNNVNYVIVRTQTIKKLAYRNLLRKASTHALIIVSRWSLPLPVLAEKEDGVSTIKPELRPK